MSPKLAAALALALLVFVAVLALGPSGAESVTVPMDQVPNGGDASVVEPSSLVVPASSSQGLTDSERRRLSLAIDADAKVDQPALEPLSDDVALLVGRVVTSAGQPIAGAQVLSVAADPTLFATTDSAGEFETQVPCSLYAFHLLKITASDFYTLKFLSVGQGEGAIPMIPGGAGKPTVLGDIQLLDALILRGRVVDEEQRGLEGAWVSGAGASRVPSSSDGTFRLPNVLASAKRANVRLAGYERKTVEFSALAGSVHDLGDVALVKGTPAEAEEASDDSLCTFRVVDSKTGEGLLDYWAQRKKRIASLLGVSSVWSDLDARYMKKHASPEVLLRAVPGEDSVTFAATGYRTRSVLVREDAATEVQIVRMRAAPRISGRVVRDGQPVPFAKVAFTLGDFRKVVDAGRSEGTPYSAQLVALHSTGSPLPEQLGPSTDPWGRSLRRAIYADDTGSFSLPLPKQRSGSVAASDAAGRSEAVLFRCGIRADEDVGELELLARSTLVGRVGFSGGHEPAGTTVELQGAPGEPLEVDSEGHFRFNNVAPGDALLTVRVNGDLELEGGATIQRFHARVDPGDTREVVLSIETRATAMVEFTVKVNGAPAAGYFFTAVPLSDSSSRSSRLDGAGRLTKVVATGVPLRVYVSHEGLQLYVAEPPIIEVDQRALAIDFRCGSLILTLPSDFTDLEGLTASITPDDPPGPRASVGGQLSVHENGRIEARFQGLLPGNYGVRLHVKKTDQLFQSVSLLERELTVQIAEGEIYRREL